MFCGASCAVLWWSAYVRRWSGVVCGFQTYPLQCEHCARCKNDYARQVIVVAKGGWMITWRVGLVASKQLGLKVMILYVWLCSTASVWFWQHFLGYVTVDVLWSERVRSFRQMAFLLRLLLMFTCSTCCVVASFMLLYLNEYHVAQAVYTLHGDSKLWLDNITKAQVQPTF